jgi:hypothetical protein
VRGCVAAGSTYAVGAMTDRPPRSRSHLGGPAGALAFFAAAVVAMSGCFTGERPTLAENTTTGSPEVDALIERVDAVGDAVFTARYDVLTAFTNQTTAVTAAQSEPGRRSLTVGDVRYLHDGSSARTCTVSTGECIESIDASRVSDVQVTPDFLATALSARIRHDAEVAVGPPTATTEQIQDETASCVAIPVEAATITYCVLDNGVLARMDAADIDVTMTDYSTAADESLFTPTG